MTRWPLAADPWVTIKNLNKRRRRAIFMKLLISDILAFGCLCETEMQSPFDDP
jgi:hypothetical protein